jgi:hypothetical protein
MTKLYNNILVFISLCFITQISIAQITVTNSTFPKAGDNLRVVTRGATFPFPPNTGIVGGPQVWDFSKLNSGNVEVTNCLNASEGQDFASFPSAELVFKDADGQEQYIDVTASKMSLIGLGGMNDFSPIPVQVKFETAPSFKIAPLTYILSTTSIGKFNIDLGSEIIPDSLALPIMIDSIRIQFSSNERGLVDGFGKVKMQNKEIDVLRQTVERITDTKAFVKTLFGWTDATAILEGLGGLPGLASNFLGKDTTRIVNFISGSHKEILVSVEYAADSTFQAVSFADIGGLISATEDIKNKIKFVQSAPNPTADYTDIDISSLPIDTYMVVLYNLHGQAVNAQWISNKDISVHRVEMSNVPQGSYTISIINKKQQLTAVSKILRQ